MSNKMRTDNGVVVNEADAMRDLIQSIKGSGEGNDYYMGIEDNLHRLSDEERMYTFSHTKRGVASGGSLYIFIEAGAEDIHIAGISWAGELKTSLQSFSNPTVTVAGTDKPPFNRATGGPSEFVGTITYDPTLSSDGTPRADDLRGTGTGPATARAGGGGVSSIESKVNAGTNLLLKLTNESSSTAYLSIVINMYNGD